ncbi:Bug family tripartite tricarboxylate transporter substrate binding protein [Dysosmobacter sp.]|uniref:Bug family tripartite tricarboxylate transporter substrate binding protein n=1 Tax=Dysosmobacter sp. TaxID=2591382 RepID=UPI002A871C06|nr:tripartite tricarboxylate transporter substrate-binding protein [Dysosmobacter sp.]MDY3984983.1 tripartite tricarboxylate transporter substrate-binding protein [Dysosmobacter sp.]
MKKLMALTLALLMTLSLAACGSSGETGKTEGGSSAESEGFVPSKTVTWICTSSAGGGSDIFSRKISDIMKNDDLVNGQTIVVSNETDGSGEVGRNKVATMKAGDADYTLLTFNSGDLMPMVTNTKNRAANFRILAVMAVDKQLLFSCPSSDAKTDYAKAGNDQNDFAAAIEAAKNGTFVVIGGSKGDDITTYNKLLAEVGLTEDQMGYITYDSTSDAITAALGGNVDFVISKPAAASQYVESGDLSPVLALSTERFSGSLADAPTLSEIGDYENVEVPVWRGVAAPAAMSDAAVAFWSDALGKVAASEAWKTEYLETYQLIDEYKDTAAATEYVTAYEADYMAENGLS